MSNVINNNNLHFLSDLPRDVLYNEIGSYLGPEFCQIAQVDKECRAWATSALSQELFANNLGLEVSEQQEPQKIVKTHISNLLGRLKEIREEFKNTEKTTVSNLTISKIPLTIDQVPFLEEYVSLYDAIKLYPKEQISKDIKLIFEKTDLSSLSASDLTKLREYIKARDTIIVWHAIAKAARVPVPFDIGDKTFWSEAQKVQDTAAEFTQWCNGNQAQLKSVNRLSLMDNKLTYLSKEIGDLTALKTLWLQNNQLTYVPPEIGNCIGLSELDLSKNKLKDIPNELGNLVALNKLWLDSNKLKDLPDLGKLTALTELWVENNELASLPRGVSKLKKLRTLLLDNNHFVTFPEQIRDLTTLTEVWFQDNKIKNLPTWLCNLTALRKIYLRGNDIKLPEGFQWPPKLKDIPDIPIEAK